MYPQAAWWLPIAVALALCINAVGLFYLHRKLSAPHTGVPRPSDAPALHTCAECGLANEPGYRYCGGCAAELPRFGGRVEGR